MTAGRQFMIRLAQFTRLLRIVQRQVRLRTGALEDWLGHGSLLHFVDLTRRTIRLPAAQKIREPSDVRERRVSVFLSLSMWAAAP